MRHPNLRVAAAALMCVLGVCRAPSAHAWDLPAANKMIALVQSAGCDLPQLRQRMGVASKALVDDPRATRVVVDWPADPERNLDVMGRPSPILAVLEVTAAPRALPSLAEGVGRQLGGSCRVGFYLVHERRLLSVPRTWPVGQASPGIRIVSGVVKRDSVSLEDFDTAWAGPEAKLALSWRTVSGQAGGHYVQNLVVERLTEDAPLLNGIGEGEGARAGSESEREARMKTAEFARAFVDTTKTIMFAAREFVLKD